MLFEEGRLENLRELVIQNYKVDVNVKAKYDLTTSMYEKVFDHKVAANNMRDKLVSMQWGEFIEGVLGNLPGCEWLNKKYVNVSPDVTGVLATMDFMHTDSDGKKTFFELKARRNTVNYNSRHAILDKIQKVRDLGHGAYVVYYDSPDIKNTLFELSGRQFFSTFFKDGKLFDVINDQIANTNYL